jgi:hypothetical protein
MVENAFILYRPEAFIEIGSKRNIFKSRFVYGSPSYLEGVVSEFEHCGLSVVRYII